MSWKIHMIGTAPVRCDVETLKEAILQFSTVKCIPESGYLIAKERGGDEFQLEIRSGTIWHMGELLIGDPSIRPPHQKAMVDQETSESRDSDSYSTLPEDVKTPSYTYPLSARFLIAISVIVLVSALISAAILALDGYTASSISRAASGLTQMGVLFALGEILAHLNRTASKPHRCSKPIEAVVT